MKRIWSYYGDIDIANGGYFYNTQNWQYDYAEVVRVTPCSDAGGPDNQFWIESLTLNGVKDNSQRIGNALDVIGVDLEELHKMSPASRRACVIDALVGYGYYDIEWRREIQIGARAEPCSGSFHPLQDVAVLRANVSLRRYVRALCEGV